MISIMNNILTNKKILTLPLIISTSSIINFYNKIKTNDNNNKKEDLPIFFLIPNE